MLLMDNGEKKEVSNKDIDQLIRSLDKHFVPLRSPVMINHLERNLLYFLANKAYFGQGEIIDAGSFTGGSTFSLCYGLLSNRQVKNLHGRIHSYDKFIANKFMLTYLQNAKDGDCFINDFISNISPFRDFVNVYAGDFLNKCWTGDPIEILFCDIAKSGSLNAHLFKEFFPFLSEESIVIFQDFVFTGCPWHHYNLGYIFDHIDIVGAFPPSLVFQIKQSIPEQKLKNIVHDNFTMEDKVHYCEKLLPLLNGDAREATRLNIAFLLQKMDRYKEANTLLRNINFPTKIFNRFIPKEADLKI